MSPQQDAAPGPSRGGAPPPNQTTDLEDHLVTTPTRIQRRRTRGWRLPPGAVIVDRTSRFGNPFTIAGAMDVLGYDEVTARKYAVAAFGPWLSGSRAEWESHEADLRRERILANLHLLRGKDLACPCEPGEPCHADAYLPLVNVPAVELDAWISGVRARVDRQRVARGERPMYDPEAGAR